MTKVRKDLMNTIDQMEALNPEKVNARNIMAMINACDYFGLEPIMDKYFPHYNEAKGIDIDRSILLYDNSILLLKGTKLSQTDQEDLKELYTESRGYTNWSVDQIKEAITDDDKRKN